MFVNYEQLISKFDNFEDYQNNLEELLHETVWGETQKIGSKAAYESYLRNYPEGLHKREAIDNLDKINVKEIEATEKKQKANDRSYWSRVCNKDSKDFYERYLNKYPSGNYKDEAISRINKINEREMFIDNEISKEYCLWEEARGKNTSDSYLNYITAYPNGKYIIECRIKYDGEILVEKELDNFIRWAGDNEISDYTIPRTIEGLKNIKEIHLYGENITYIPDSIRYLLSLEKLEIYECKLLQSLPQSIKELPKLSEVTIRNCIFELLPSPITEMHDLKKLVISCSSITSLPSSISNLCGLKELKISSSEIKSIPESIGRLENLESLYIDCDGIEDLPGSIKNIANLKSFHLGGNWFSSPKLKKLPEWFGELANIESLMLQNPQQLPNSVISLKKLKRLLFNTGGEYPDVIGRLTTLDEIDLGDCSYLFGSASVNCIPDFIEELSNLKKLVLCGGDVREIPSWIGNLTSLTEIYLTKCYKLTEIPQSIGNLSNLEKLFITSHSATNLPNSIGQLKKIKHIDVFGSELLELPTSLGEYLPEYYQEVFRKLRIDIESWNRAKRIDSTKSYLEYIELHPNGHWSYEAKSKYNQKLNFITRLFKKKID